MDAPDTDVYRTVEYGRERYWMNRVPWALLACAAGLFMIAMDPGPPGIAPFLFLGALMIVASAYAISTFAYDHAFDSLKPIWTVGFVLALALGVLVFIFVPPRYLRRDLFDPFQPSMRTLGWMFVFFSCGYVAFALLKHFRPETPVLRLSPTGIEFNYSWLRDLRIPWYEVERVGLLEHILAGGIVSRFPNNPIVAVSQEFYERNMLPRRTFLSGQFWSGLFQSHGKQVQILLPWPWFSVSMAEMSEAVDARWKAFREQPDAHAPSTTAPPLRASAWSVATMTPWRRVALGIPLASLILMLVHFAGVWDTPFLRWAREDARKAHAHEQAVRDSASKGQFTIDSGQRRH